MDTYITGSMISRDVLKKEKPNFVFKDLPDELPNGINRESLIECPCEFITIDVSVSSPKLLDTNVGLYALEHALHDLSQMMGHKIAISVNRLKR